MLHFILQTISFQLFFLIIYDAFLKKETFFNWNRAYLLVTAILSVALPFIKIQSFKNVVPKEFVIAMPEVTIGNVQGINTNQAVEIVATESSKFQWSWELVFYIGASLALIIFFVKLLKIATLIYKNPKHWNQNLRIVTLLRSNTAFSFFYYVFLGEQIKEVDKPAILKHEAVHVKQKHTLDLLFFELFRIVFWFNPLIYMYQNRIALLHEFIADAEAIKSQCKNEYYQDLLSQIFEIKNVSFINAFNKKSLIKKRIVMLSKAKSKKSSLLKYTILIPMIFVMLLYSSSYAQEIVENIPVEEDVLIQDPIEVPFSVVGEVPIYPGCENITDPKEQRKCMSDNISQFVQKNFNTDLAKQKELIGRQRINVIFKIDTLGSITEIRSRASHPDLEKEAERVISLLPKMQPGKHKGKKVSVPYSLPIIFEVAKGSNNSKEEISQEEKETYEKSLEQLKDMVSNNSIPFSVVDKIPTLPNCNNLSSNSEQQKCVSDEIIKFTQKNFNTDLATKLNLKGQQRIMIVFIINENGLAVVDKVRAPHPDLEAEAIRTIKLLPKFIPGEHEGKKVNVSYALPIVFMIQ
jgi:bla regulator protein blaR1